MFEQLTQRLDFHAQALGLRAYRQQVLASNMANAETPGYVGRDFDFSAALKDITERTEQARTFSSRMGQTQGPLNGEGMKVVMSSGELAKQVGMAYTIQSQPSMDGNSVDMDRERANFTDNAVRYESTLRFINGHVKTMLSAIQGQ